MLTPHLAPGGTWAWWLRHHCRHRHGGRALRQAPQSKIGFGPRGHLEKRWPATLAGTQPLPDSFAAPLAVVPPRCCLHQQPDRRGPVRRTRCTPVVHMLRHQPPTCMDPQHHLIAERHTIVAAVAHAAAAAPARGPPRATRGAAAAEGSQARTVLLGLSGSPAPPVVPARRVQARQAPVCTAKSAAHDSRPLHSSPCHPRHRAVPATAEMAAPVQVEVTWQSQSGR
mmetsp:Transcript_3687/g.10679  ORF Transcript_3687/g.10679 Transcript_3687/m.10679 type:complete len:226 (+) Transcript_3687:580-1257(+)